MIIQRGGLRRKINPKSLGPWACISSLCCRAGMDAALVWGQKDMRMAMFKNSGQCEGTAHENLGFEAKRARKFTRTSPRTLPWNFITMLSAPLISERAQVLCRCTHHREENVRVAMPAEVRCEVFW